MIPNFYQSPSRSRVVKRLENKLLAADDSWWTRRHPLYTRVVAKVPLALYLNFLANKSYVASLSPCLFRPLDLPGNPNATLFTLLLFSLERARPLWAPRALGALAPRFMQSNWRFYGHITGPGRDSRQGVLFVRTVTTSLILSVFGRRLARCFPLLRAYRMRLECASRRLTGRIDPSGGCGPELVFEGEQTEWPPISIAFSPQFSAYADYARWIIDQHLSLVIWPREYVVQDMHLDFQEAKIIPLRCLNCRIAGLEDFIPHDRTFPMDCFAVEGLKVFLDKICAARKE
jgi:hypothetical protein